MSDCDLVRLLRFPGSPPIQLRAADEILRLRAKVEELTTQLAIEKLSRPESSCCKATG